MRQQYGGISGSSGLRSSMDFAMQVSDTSMIIWGIVVLAIGLVKVYHGK